MQLRDYFAAAALPQCLALSAELIALGKDRSLEEVCKDAYELADKMLIVREVG